MLFFSGSTEPQPQADAVLCLPGGSSSSSTTMEGFVCSSSLRTSLPAVHECIAPDMHLHNASRERFSALPLRKSDHEKLQAHSDLRIRNFNTVTRFFRSALCCAASKKLIRVQRCCAPRPSARAGIGNKHKPRAARRPRTSHWWPQVRHIVPDLQRLTWLSVSGGG